MAEWNDDPLHAAINATLARMATSTSAPPPWYEAWSRLGPDSYEEEVLAVYQAVRAAGSVPEEAGFFLVAWQVDVITLFRAEEALSELEERLESIRRAHGLDEDEDESWPPGEGPPEYEETQRQLHDAWEALYAATLDEFGEQELAQLFRSDRQRFEQLQEAGRQFFHGASASGDAGEETDWLDGLLEAVVNCVEADSPMGPFGLRYSQEDDFWEVSIYPTAVELMGGAHDGEIVAPGFSLDLEGLRALFDTVVACSWNALGLNYPEGPHLSIEGVYQGHEIWLQVLAQSPEDEEPGLKFDTSRRPRRPS